MNVRQMREELMKRYPSDSFKKKMEKASDAQVAAIYLRLKREGKI